MQKLLVLALQLRAALDEQNEELKKLEALVGGQK